MLYQAHEGVPEGAVAPHPKYDETISSYVTRLWRLATFRSRSKVSYPYISGDLDSTSNPFPVGITSIDRWLHAYWPEGNIDFIEQHSVLPLFRPFVSSDCYSKAEKSFRSGGAPKMIVHWESHSALRYHSACCPACVEGDIERDGFSYWRRLHQFTAVRYCPEHDVALCNKCRHCGFLLSSEALPQLTCRNCLAPLGSSDPPPISTSERHYTLAVAMVLRDVLEGRFPILGHRTRLAVLRRQASKVLGKSAPERIGAYMEECFGETWDEELELVSFLRTGQGEQWPLQFLSAESKYRLRDPIANVMLVAAFFESTKAFVEAVDTYDEAIW